MRILYIDIDTLRPDHLGCYGYHRNTSPNIDGVAAKGTRFDNCYVSDAPCLPSRAALYSGKCGIRNGAVNHGGKAAELLIDTRRRHFRTLEDNFIYTLRKAGFYTVSVSPFGERHSSFWFYNGFREIYNTGKGGGERSDEVVPTALDWLDRNGAKDNWYLHVNVWDPHTPYQVPMSEGNPFKDDAPPSWMTESIIRKNWDNYGPGSGQEPGGGYLGTSAEFCKTFPRVPRQIKTLKDYRKWIDGYDCGIYYADKHAGMILDKLKDLGIDGDTVVMISSDHGENQGELSVYGDHQTADHITNRVPMIIYDPKGRIGKCKADKSLHYQFDVAATLLELAGGNVPQTWDGKSFLGSLRKGRPEGRDYLVVSNCAWACQRAVRWDNYIMIKTYHSGYKNYPEIMLFDLEKDPHELANLADKRPDLVDHALARLEEWKAEEMKRSFTDIDPMWTVMREGGPFHASYGSPNFEKYAERLRKTGRGKHAKDFARRKESTDFIPVDFK